MIDSKTSELDVILKKAILENPLSREDLLFLLNAGANVVTSVIPPHSGLAGVSNHSLDIEDGNRTISKITPVLAKQGLVSASREDYEEWVLKRKNHIIPWRGAFV